MSHKLIRKKHERYLRTNVPPSSPPSSYLKKRISQRKNFENFVDLRIQFLVSKVKYQQIWKESTYISTDSEDDEADDAGDEEEHHRES